MAIYCFIMKTIGGNSGRSAVGAAAYRAGENLKNELDGVSHNYGNRKAIGAAAYRAGEKLHSDNQAHDYTKKSGIVHSEIMLPTHAPKSYQDRGTLWNAVGKAEKQHNARTAREIVVALPNELTTEQQIELLQDYIQRNFVDDGMCADFSIHSGQIHTRKDEVYPFQDLTIQKDNPHAHIMLTVRPIDKDGKWGAKSRKEYILDRNGNKIKLPSGNWKSRKVDSTNWDKTETLLKWREDWAVTVNKKFKQLGIDERIDHRSLKEQGIEREPTKHMGHNAWNLEKKGTKTDIGNKNRAIMARNKVLEQTERKVQALTPENIAEHIHELRENYIIADMKAMAIKQEIKTIERETLALQVKIEDIDHRAQEIKTYSSQIAELKHQRRGMGLLANKNDIDEKIRAIEHSHEQATDTFKRVFVVEWEISAEVIKRIEFRIKELEQAKKPLEEKLPSMLVDRENFSNEYTKQRRLVDVHKDRERILKRLEELEKEIQKNLTPKERTARFRNEQKAKEMQTQGIERDFEIELEL